MPSKLDDLRDKAKRLGRDADALAREIEQFAATPDGKRESLTDADIRRIVDRAINIFEAKPPRPPHVTMTQAAEMLGVSRYIVRQMLHAGQFRLNKCGRIPIEQVDAALASRER